jgi:hypothetical protein
MMTLLAFTSISATDSALASWCTSFSTGPVAAAVGAAIS